MKNLTFMLADQLVTILLEVEVMATKQPRYKEHNDGHWLMYDMWPLI